MLNLAFQTADCGSVQHFTKHNIKPDDKKGTTNITQYSILHPVTEMGT